MYRLALLCLLIAGCASAHGATVRVRRAKSAKKPVQVAKVRNTADRGLTHAVSQEAAAPAAAHPVVEALEEESERHAAKIQKKIIDSISSVADDPGPSPPPPPPAPPPVTEPFLNLPGTVDGDVGDFIEVVAQTNCKAVHYYIIDKGLKKLPDSIPLTNPVATIVQSMTPGSYRMMAVAAAGDEIVGPVEVMVVVHGPMPPPLPVPPAPPVPNPAPPAPPAPPPPVPPPLPVSTQATKLWIVVATDAVGIDAKTAQVTGDVSFWNSVRAQGHVFANYNRTQDQFRKYQSIVAQNGGTPAIIILDASNIPINGPVPTNLPWLNQGSYSNGYRLTAMPDSTAGVKALINKYTSRPVP